MEGIYRLDRGEEDPLSGPRKLLWHGTSVSNLLSILTSGLQVGSCPMSHDES